ncbi:MAG: phosphate ABC transporter permease PstA [Promicromonosporaceae bacterium]|nr:phosphate ABC transporter permease PstA [Promicromonosporaceae bacterium]
MTTLTPATGSALKGGLSAKRRAYSIGLRTAMYACVAIAVSVLVGIIGFVLYQGLGHITWELLSTQRSALRNTIGILPNILSTLYIVITTLLIAIPIGIGAAIYLCEYASNRKVVRLVEFTIEILAGIPSIIYGLVGFLFFVLNLGMRPSILVGSLTLSILVLPVIVRTTQEALRTVPHSYREGAFALGGTRWYIIRTIILPSSLDGIIGGTILAVGRMVGESAALLFTAGVGFTLVTNYFTALHTPGASLTVSLFLYITEHGNRDVGFAIAAILLIIVLTLNLLIKLVRRKFRKI